jgi:hypothetical protein
VILLGTMWLLIAVNLLRSVARRLPRGKGGGESRGVRRVAVVGRVDEASRVLGIIRMMDAKCDFWGIITTEPTAGTDNRVIGDLSQMEDLLTLYRINDVIFCSRDLSSEQIIDLMCQLQTPQREFKIAPEGSMSVIGSNAIFSPESAFTIDIHSITQTRSRRRKRAFDIAASLLLLLLLIFDIWFVKKKGGFVRNIFHVLSGRKSWVGFSHHYAEGPLAQLKPGVLHPTDAFPNYHFPDEMLTTSDQLYARDYTPKKDLVILFRGFSKLGS